MKSFFNKKKIISSTLIISLLFGLSPIFSTQTSAQAEQGVDKGVAAGIMGTATGINATCYPLVTALGYTVPPWFACDPGVRFNTLQMLGSALGVTPGTAMKESVWDSIAYFAGRILIRQISQSIVNWINSGFQGNPSFIEDPLQFITDTADRTIGEFIFASDLKALCQPFEINIRLNLGLQYSPFQDRINCRLSDVLKNVDGAVTKAYNDFMNGDFINGGGWDSWLNITTVPQNNQIGAMIIAQAELDAQIADKQLAKNNELNWSGGLLSMKNCTRTTYNSDGDEMEKVNYRGDPAFFKTPGTTANTDVTRDESRLGISTKDECQIVTPGTWITGTGNKVLGMDLDRLGAADEINEIVGALANFVISKVMEKGMAMVRGDDLSPNNSNWRAGIASLQAQQNADMAAGSASAKSGSSYTPNYYSYTNLASPEVINARTNILNTISVILTSEQAYYDAYNYIYSAADLMKEKFLGVINCYQGKISYNNPPLTNSELNTANNQISTASATVNYLNGILNSIDVNMTISQNNLSDLQTIIDNTNNASTMSDLNMVQNDLTNLAPSLHNSNQALEAQAISASTTAQIITYGPIGDNMFNQCAAFPVR